MLIEAARRQSKAVMVEIRIDGLQLFQNAMDGTDRVNVDWIKESLQTHFESTTYLGGRRTAR